MRSCVRSSAGLRMHSYVVVYPYIPRCLRSCAHVAAEDVSSVVESVHSYVCTTQEDIVHGIAMHVCLHSSYAHAIATYLLPSVVPTRGHSTMCSSYAYLRREVCRGVDAHLVGVHTSLCSCIHSSLESCVCTPHSAISLPHRGHSSVRSGVHSSVESAVHSY